jgi:hypothetical protein
VERDSFWDHILNAKKWIIVLYERTDKKWVNRCILDTWIFKFYWCKLSQLFENCA